MASPSYNLNRLTLIDGITAQTPACVLVEIAKAHRIHFDGSYETVSATTPEKILRIITSIAATRTETVTISSENLPVIACYVNADCVSWPDSNILMAAFQHLESVRNRPVPLPQGDWTIGPKTPRFPFNYDATMLYAICQYYGVATHRMTSLNHLAFAVRSLMEPVSSLRSRTVAIVEQLPTPALTSLLMAPAFTVPAVTSSVVNHPLSLMTSGPVVVYHSSYPSLPPISVGSVTETEIQQTRISLDTNTLMFRAVPICQKEAILLGALNFRLNLSEAADPFTEYMQLRSVYTVSEGYLRYIPTDPNFRKVWLRNSDWYNMRKTWTPLFGTLYSEHDLMNFALGEGYLRTNFREMSVQNCLEMARLMPNFYGGLHPYCEEELTQIMLHDIGELHRDLLLSFGNVAERSFKLYTVQELADYFMSEQAFRNPNEEGECFSRLQMNKLRQILQRRVENSNLPSMVKDANQRLLTVMGSINERLAANHAKSKEFVTYYQSLDGTEQKQVVDFLQHLLHLSMTMRGWKITNGEQFPLRKPETETNRADLVERINQNSMMALLECNIYLESLPEKLQVRLKALPLVRFTLQDGEDEFQLSNSPEEGFTIWDRLQIVSMGSYKFPSMKSCIRVSSLWLASSAYCYMIVIGLPKPFEIRKLEMIS
jgi:hypothetical protein